MKIVTSLAVFIVLSMGASASDWPGQFIKTLYEVETNDVEGFKDKEKKTPQKCTYAIDLHEGGFLKIYLHTDTINFGLALKRGQGGQYTTLSQGETVEYKNGVLRYSREYKEDGVTEITNISLKVDPALTSISEGSAKYEMKGFSSKRLIEELNCRF